MQDLTPAEIEALTKAMGSPYTGQLNVTESASTPKARVHLSQLQENLTTAERTTPTSNAALKTPVRIDAIFGRTTLTVAELLNLRPGSVLQLEEMAGELVTLEANGVPIAKGEIVVVDHHFGIRLIESY